MFVDHISTIMQLLTSKDELLSSLFDKNNGNSDLIGNSSLKQTLIGDSAQINNGKGKRTDINIFIFRFL